MKVVLFCGGYGMRMRDGVTNAPKPMAMIGDRPLLWHVMRYYAHYGHTEFILCLGYGGTYVKDYFLHYRETSSNDFIMRDGGRTVDLITSDIADWTITFVDTGLNATIGERLLRVRKYVEDDQTFLANYADVLTDAPLPELVAELQESGAVGLLLAVPPQSSFHVVGVETGSNKVRDIKAVATFPIRENGGYFVLGREIFDYLNEGEDLVDDAFGRLVSEGRLIARCYDGFWASADTVKERAQLEALFHDGSRPWALWNTTPKAQRGWAGPERRRRGKAGAPARDEELR
ncbi:MAG: glucose-1-phosphate cytidylyltransferase [Pseudonocardiales bacterium]